MNLREQIEKEITDKVMTKLASEKVELALVDDIKKMAKFILNKGFLDLNTYNTLKSRFEDYIDLSKKLLKDVEKVKKTAKDLGLDVPKDIITIDTEINSILKDFNRAK